MHRPLRAIAVLVSAAALLLVPACSKSTREKAKETLQSAQHDAASGTAQVRARADAEAIRVALKADSPKDLRSVAAIKAAMAKATGSPQVTGLTDANGDGRDDDGKVQVTVDGRSACLTLPATGSDTSVHDGAC